VNLRIFFKSVKFAFRARRRVISFIIIYAILYVLVGKELAGAPIGLEWPWIILAFIVSTIYAILISQFRRRDIAILKCVSWGNQDIMILLIGEVVLVALAAFFVVFQLSIEVLGLIAYFGDIAFLLDIQSLIVVPVAPMLTTLLLVVVLQLPGLGLAQYRAMKIPPMRALREE
jgi:hypothetical protein